MEQEFSRIPEGGGGGVSTPSEGWTPRTWWGPFPPPPGCGLGVNTTQPFSPQSSSGRGVLTPLSAVALALAYCLGEGLLNLSLPLEFFALVLQIHVSGPFDLHVAGRSLIYLAARPCAGSCEPHFDSGGFGGWTQRGARACGSVGDFPSPLLREESERRSVCV